MCSVAVAASFSGRLPKVEFMLSSFLGEIIPAGSARVELSVAKARFHGRRVVERLRAEVALAGRRAEAAIGERQEWRPGATRSRTKRSRSSSSSVMPRTKGCGIEQRADHVVVGIGEAGVVEAHARRERAEDFHVRIWFRRAARARAAPAAGSSGRRRGRGRCAPGTWWRAAGYRRIGGVVLELLQHHGEQVARRRPRRTAFWLGAMAAGFEL
jgi:hypothetical protein